ncbi:uncharacterized protein A4U43_C03F530 [Asparagus officinalis]|uniref:Uncharacterized protein n=1 Tax=Asparagus officinalis TaxID=4686 RepID=A0A5P1FB64_ASPOF|nr:uncharacterized protein A4U43_C03F530 [Asparagus officinalis]
MADWWQWMHLQHTTYSLSFVFTGMKQVQELSTRTVLILEMFLNTGTVLHSTEALTWVGREHMAEPAVRSTYFASKTHRLIACQSCRSNHDFVNKKNGSQVSANMPPKLPSVHSKGKGELEATENGNCSTMKFPCLREETESHSDLMDWQDNDWR